MELREAEMGDQEAVVDIAEQSLRASYSLEPEDIEGAVGQWYNESAFEEKLEDPDAIVLVAEMDGEVVGFSESLLLSEGGVADLLWLHVRPGHRGHRVGSILYEYTHAKLTDMDASHLRGRVLEDNEVGNAFYENRGFTLVGEDEVEIDGRTYVERLWLEAEPGGMEAVTIEDGRQAFVDLDTEEPGSEAPFHVVYLDAGGERRYGYYCANCETMANSMDAMGRIRCDRCGNTRKPTRWDSAYL